MELRLWVKIPVVLLITSINLFPSGVQRYGHILSFDHLKFELDRRVPQDMNTSKASILPDHIDRRRLWALEYHKISSKLQGPWNNAGRISLNCMFGNDDSAKVVDLSRDLFTRKSGQVLSGSPRFSMDVLDIIPDKGD